MVSNNQVLLREFFELCDGGVCTDLLTESEKREVRDNKAVYLSGIMQRADAKNGNGRIYPHNTLQREIETYQKIVRENRAGGELDHPDDSVVNLTNISHRVVNIWWDGKDVMGKIKVSTTPAGKILEAHIRDGLALGISSRGLGTLTETNEGLLVEDDFQLICFDMVSEPSTPAILDLFITTLMLAPTTLSPFFILPILLTSALIEA